MPYPGTPTYRGIHAPRGASCQDSAHELPAADHRPVNQSVHVWCVEVDGQAVRDVWCGMSRSRSPHVHPRDLRRHPLDPLEASHPRPTLDDDLRGLADYADPDCPDCHGSGQLHRMPCDACIIGVWL